MLLICTLRSWDGNRKDVFYSELEVAAYFPACATSKDHFLYLPQKQTAVWEASSTATCKLQLYPTAEGQLAKSLKHISQSWCKRSLTLPFWDFHFRAREKCTEGRENSWQGVQLAANQDLGCSKATSLKPDCPAWRTTLGESAGISFKWLGRAGSPDDAD